MNELKIKDVENLIKEIIMIYKYLQNIHRGIDRVSRAKSLIDYEEIDGDRLDFLRYQQINGNYYDETKNQQRYQYMNNDKQANEIIELISEILLKYMIEKDLKIT